MTYQELEQEKNWWKEHADLLDRNWEAHIDACLNAIRYALEMPDASVPEMCDRILLMKQSLKKSCSE